MAPRCGASGRPHCSAAAPGRSGRAHARLEVVVVVRFTERRVDAVRAAVVEAHLLLTAARGRVAHKHGLTVPEKHIKSKLRDVLTAWPNNTPWVKCN